LELCHFYKLDETFQQAKNGLNADERWLRAAGAGQKTVMLLIAAC
jgi:hypothetical protein